MSIFDVIDLSAIQDEQAREGIILLLNLVEEQSQLIRTVQAENQRLKDEINRLKGEQGQPPIKPNVPPHQRIIPPKKNGDSPNHVPPGVNARRSRLTGKSFWKWRGRRYQQMPSLRAMMRW